MSNAVTQLDHPQLGAVAGRRKGGTVQFLGLKYGVLKHRFAVPEVNQKTNKNVLDATRYGPPVVMPPGSCDMEMAFIQQTLDKPSVPPPSDLGGLNLNVSVPILDGELPGADARLPVLVYVHGGGFAFGSSSYPHYDQARMVDLALEMGQPLIAININYRLGVPGFLTSTELRDLGGFGTNNGLRDQRIAFRWIKQYISGFGGNPEAITAIGQSAGAASLTYHLHSHEPLFHQCILLAGTFLMMRAGDFNVAENVYDVVLKDLGLNHLSASERIKSLLELDPSEFVQKVTPTMLLGPVVDNDMIPGVASFSHIGDERGLPLPGKGWCHRLMSVDCEFDGTIMALVNLNARERGIRKAFQGSVRSNPKLQATATSQKILDFYGIREDSSDQDALLSITSFITDIMFYAPSVTMAQTWETSYICHFNEGNPWEGLYRGRASHMLDIAYLWQNYNHILTSPQEAVARRFAEHVVGFTAGQEAGPKFKLGHEVTVYGPSSQGISSQASHMDDEEATSRRATFFKLAEEAGGLDVLLEAASHFLIG